MKHASSYGSDGDKNQTATLENVPIMDNADLPRLIGLQGCGSSEAYQLLNNRMPLITMKIAILSSSVGFQLKFYQFPCYILGNQYLVLLSSQKDYILLHVLFNAGWAAAINAYENPSTYFAGE